MLDDGHHDRQLTALDFDTGWRVFSIKGYVRFSSAPGLAPQPVATD